MAVEAGTPIYGRAATAVTGAIRNAASATGTSFSYLLATAKIESDLDPSLTTKSSSAAGLFQFIDQTWLGTLKQAGPAFGYGNYANAITRNSSGRYVVDDPQMRKAIMKLKNDPTANAVMAGVLTQQNAAALSRHIGRAPSDSELYIAHFFGAGGAGKLIQLTSTNPQANAAEAFPLAAQANRSIFYDRQGNARSVSGVYAELTRRYKLASDGLGGTVAGVGVPPMQLAQASQRAARPAAPVADVAGTTRVFAAASAAPPASSAAAGSDPTGTRQPSPSFNSLFSDASRRSALDPAIVALWSEPADPQQPASTAAAPGAGPAAQINNSTGATSFDLFRDPQPSTSARPDNNS